MSYFESPERRPRRPVRACSRSPKKSFGLAFDHGQLAAACFGTRSHTKRQASVSSASSVLTGSTPSPKSSRASTPSQEMDGLGAANCSTLTRLKKTWSPLERLPVEIQHMIIQYIDDDRDFARYCLLVSRTISSIVDSSVYRRQFLKSFDDIPNAESAKYRTCFQFRRQLMNLYLPLDGGFRPKSHPACLAMLRDVIEHAVGHKNTTENGSSTVTGRNFDFLEKYMKVDVDLSSNRLDSPPLVGTNLLTLNCNAKIVGPGNFPASATPKKIYSLALTVRLCLLHLLLTPTRTRLRGAELCDAQQQVYQCFRKEPILKGRRKADINFVWLAHVATFFRYHLKHDGGEALLSHHYLEPGAYSGPRPWVNRIQPGTQELDKQWLGTFTYVHNNESLILMRGSRRLDDPGLIDSCSEINNGFQEMTVFLNIADHPELHWPANVDHIIDGKPMASLFGPGKRKQPLPDVKEFFGLGTDTSITYHINGRIHDLPPQNGIHGFQRISMIKYLPDWTGNYGPNRTQYWAYEGIVVPGGQVMLGRWWDPLVQNIGDGGSYCGPFIFWCTEAPGDDLIDIQEATTFMETVKDRTIW